MKHFNGNNFAIASQRILCGTLSLSISLAPLTSAFATNPSEISAQNIGRGNMATAAPDVESICASIDNAADGNFIGALTVTKPECLTLNRRQQSAPNCQQPMSTQMANMTPAQKNAKADEICGNSAKNTNQQTSSFCAIRQASADGQAKKYCVAYKSAKKAKGSLGLTMLLDVSAAGLCWKEFKSLNARLKAHEDVNKHEKGTCAKASMAAGLAEFLHVATTLNKESPKIDSDGNLNSSDKKGMSDYLSIFMKAGLSAKAIQIGVCANAGDDKFKLICGKGQKNAAKKLNTATNNYDTANANQTTIQALKNAKHDLDERIAAVNDRKDELEVAEQDLKTCEAEIQYGCNPIEAKLKSDRAREKLQKDSGLLKSARVRYTDASDLAKVVAGDNSNPEVALKRANEAVESGDKGVHRAEAYKRLNTAQSAGIVFTALAAVRAMSLMSAGKTMNEAKNILQSMFSGSNNVSTFAAGQSAGGGTNIFTSPGSGTFSQTGGNQPTKNEAIASGSPESYLLPPGASHTQDVQNVARQIPEGKSETAAMGGAAGVAGMISSIAGVTGADVAARIHAATSSAYANLPKEDSGYSTGSGGKLASAKSDGGSADLNLKGLFGDQAKEENASAENELAYRTLASEDIWHSQNPRGHNLFQIVSEKYDTVQRKSDLAP